VKQTLRKILFLGESGSGKTFAARHFLALSTTLPVKLINDHTDNPLPPNYERIPWTAALKQRECNLFFEDLIACTKSERNILLRICNFNAHHKKLENVILISHDSTHQGLTAIYKHLTHVCLMASTMAMAKTLSSLLVEYKIPKSVRDVKVAEFQAAVGKEEHSYFVLEVKSGAFAKSPGSLASVMPITSTNTLQTAALSREALLAPYRKTAEHYLPMVTEEAAKCLSLFDFVMLSLPLHSLNPASLDFTLRDAKKGSIVTVSMFDYLLMITTQSAPTKPLLDLHSYIGKYSVLPRCFVANRHKKFAAANNSSL
jgi:hypothetical protein